MYSIRLVLICLLLVGLFMAARRRLDFPEAAGLEAAADLLRVGQHISPQFHKLMVGHLEDASATYAASFRAPVAQELLDDLRRSTVHAEAAVLELVERAPEDVDVQVALRQGSAAMLGQLRAWQTEMRVRCGLAQNDKEDWITEGQHPADPVQAYQTAVAGLNCSTAARTAMYPPW